MAPEPHYQSWVQLLQPCLDQRNHVSEGTKKISEGSDTYLLPAVKERGFKTPYLRKAKANSTGAVVYEYGAEIMMRKPSARMCATDSRQV